MKSRKESTKRIKEAFKSLTGYELNLSPSNETYDHVILVSLERETPEQAAKAIHDSATVA